MRHRIVAILVLAIASIALAQSMGARRQIVGNWRLVSFDNFDAKGGTTASAYQEGRIMYDAHGNMAAQLSHRARKPLSSPSTELERAAAYSGFLSYYGRYELDEAAKSVTHQVEGSTNPNWPNTKLVRYYELSPDGNRLMLSLKNAEGRITGTLTWERLR